jgi:hypothetical protein
MDQIGLVFPSGKDVTVVARFPDISDGTGMTAKFVTKPDRYTADTATSVRVYDSGVTADPDNPGATISKFTIPSTDTAVTGSFWWRVDCIDSLSKRKMANCGTLLVEAVLWQQEEKRHQRTWRVPRA